MSEHLTDQELLLASDREGGSRAELHLAACEACRARVSELEQVEQAYRGVHAELRRTQPAPPKAWKPLPAAPTPMPARRRSWPVLAFAAAAAAAVFVTLLVRDPKPAALPAINDLLASAEKAQQPWAPTRRVALRSRKRSQLYIRPAVLIREAGAPHPLEGLFHKAGYNWNEPLSTRSYNDWRRALTRRKDSVAKSIDPKTAEPLYVLKTETDASSLQECTLSLRQRDLQPVSAELHFEAGEIVDIEEAAALAAPAPRIATAPTTAPAPNWDVAELEVRVALHNIGADLGEPLTISAGDGRLTVTGRGISPTRQAEITQALAAFPNVTTRFEAPQAAPPGATRLSESATRPNAPTDYLESHLQGRMSADQFINDTLDASDAALSRSFALAALAERYTPEVEATLPAPAQQLLGNLRADHRRALNQHLTHLSELLSLVSDGGRVPRPARDPQVPPVRLQQAAQSLDTLLTAMLTGQRPLDAARLQSALQALQSAAGGQ